MASEDLRAYLEHAGVDEPTPVLHLTYTGVIAGTTYCLARVRSAGLPDRGELPPGDTTAHWIGTPDDVIDRPSTCPACRHAARCDRDPAECAWCSAMGYQPETSEEDEEELENLTPQR